MLVVCAQCFMLSNINPKQIIGICDDWFPARFNTLCYSAQCRWSVEFSSFIDWTQLINLFNHFNDCRYSNIVNNSYLNDNLADVTCCGNAIVRPQCLQRNINNMNAIYKMYYAHFFSLKINKEDIMIQIGCSIECRALSIRQW